MENNIKPVLVRAKIFASYAGVSPSAISKAVKNFNLVADPSGLLDINDPINADYIQSHSIERQPVKIIDAKENFDADDLNLWLMAEVGNTYRPIVAWEFEAGKNLAHKEMYFPQMEMISFIKDDDGIIRHVEIGKKKHKVFYATVDQVRRLMENGKNRPRAKK